MHALGPVCLLGACTLDRDRDAIETPCACLVSDPVASTVYHGGMVEAGCMYFCTMVYTAGDAQVQVLGTHRHTHIRHISDIGTFF